MAEKITLHQEICDILVSKGNNWTSTHELASLVNQRGRYRKRDGTTVSDFQIHGRTRNIKNCLNVIAIWYAVALKMFTW